MSTESETAAKKSLGQHWLTDEKILNDIAAQADLNASDTVLEIGPGHGSLTRILAKQVARVVAVEKDDVLAHELLEKVQTENVTVVNGDILTFDFSELPVGFKIVANIPYYLTSKLIRVISEAKNPPVCSVLLVQKEVAERIAAQPGAMSILSVTAQYYWDVSLGSVVASQHFSPPPKVDSRIVVLNAKATKRQIEDTRAFFRLVKAGFSQRRKTMLNSLSAGLRIPKNEVQKNCDSARIDVSRRAQTLSMDEWISLYFVVNNFVDDK